VIEHPDQVGQREGLGLVVGDVHRGGAAVAGQGGDLDPEPLAQVGVEIGQRLVEQQQAGPGHHGASQRDPLLLAAGELVGIAGCQCAEPDPLENLVGAAGGFGARQAAAAKRVADVAQHTQVWPQGVVLEHHGEVAVLGGEVAASVADQPPTESEFPGVEAFHPGQ